MEISRRRLLQLGLVQVGSLTLPAHGALPAGVNVARRSEPSIIQGATDSSRTQFSIVHPVALNYVFRVQSPSGQVWTPDHIDKHVFHAQARAITKVYFSGLHLNQTFTLTLQDPRTSAIVDIREFEMLDMEKGSLRFAICSCMDEFRHSPGIWVDLVAQNPDLIIFAGDSTYCDYGGSGAIDPARLWQRFSEARATLEIYFAKRLIPIIATWDDHDFGKNDSGREFPYLKESQENFLGFFAMNEKFCTGLSRGPGVSSRFVVGGQQFMLMDDRSWRVAGPSRERYAHWGQTQEEWLLDHVADFPGMTWIVNGSQVFPQMIFKQSLSGEHPAQFDALKRALSGIPRRVAFISGDVHFSEISQIESEIFGYQTYEFTSSSIHSQKLPGAPEIISNPRRIVATGQHNYLMIESEPNGRGSHLTVESRSEQGRVNFTRQLSV